MNNWVSVEDALPPEHGPPLIVTNNLSGRNAFGHMSHVFQVSMLHSDGEGGFCAFTDDLSMQKIWGVTHWMPILPPASVDTHPKGGDSTQIEAPAPLSGAVPSEETGDAQHD